MLENKHITRFLDYCLRIKKITQEQYDDLHSIEWLTLLFKSFSSLEGGIAVGTGCIETSYVIYFLYSSFTWWYKENKYLK
mgnify:CR=1 FL=1